MTAGECDPQAMLLILWCSKSFELIDLVQCGLRGAPVLVINIVSSTLLHCCPPKPRFTTQWPQGKNLSPWASYLLLVKLMKYFVSSRQDVRCFILNLTTLRVDNIHIYRWGNWGSERLHGPKSVCFPAASAWYVLFKAWDLGRSPGPRRQRWTALDTRSFSAQFASIRVEDVPSRAVCIPLHNILVLCWSP